MQRTIEYLRRYFCLTPRFFAGLLGAVVLVSVMSPSVMAVNVVTVTDTEHDKELLVMTTSDAADEILEMAGIEPGELDEVIVSHDASGIETVLVERNYTFPVTLAADGQEYTAEFLEGTVQDLLEECGVTLGEEDYTSYALDSALEDGMHVTVNRITYGTEQQPAAEVDERTVDAYISTLPEDFAFKKSDKGQYDVVWQHRYDNGEITHSEILEMMPLFGVRGEDTTEFIEGVAISRIEEFEGVTLGADGLPTEYSWVMENAVTTAYSSSRGTGASGLGLYYGTVAVNPAVIPYGSRLYITSADGSFVYGFAIATDTGTALREGHVDIDLFFETNAECLRFGKRSLVVYVLE